MDSSDITVGQVSGAIAFAAFLVASTLQLAIVVVLVGFLRGKNNAVTWSAIRLLDIQYRQWAHSKELLVDDGKDFITGKFRVLDSLVLHDAIEPVEGLVVDSKKGRVAFRNHTVPAELRNGATWWEDLLWVEPVTTCVNTNLSLHFTYNGSASSSNQVTDKYLQDDGGFASLARDYPHRGLWNNTDGVPDLQARAYKAAWLSNGNSARFLNATFIDRDRRLTNSTIGMTFPIGNNSYNGYSVDPTAIKITPIDGAFLDLFSRSSNMTAQDAVVTRRNFSDAELLCAGYGGADVSKDVNLASLIFDPGTKWTQSLYVCASGVRASIKRVHFTINNTALLSDTRIEKVLERDHPDPASMPLWAVENSDLNISDVSLAWGLVGDEYERAASLLTRRSKDFWLPAASPVLELTGVVDSFAGAKVFSAALNSVYNLAATSMGDSAAISYSGKDNFAMFAKWQQLSQAPDTASRIINLIYTDLLAFATVGTKSVFSTSPQGVDPSLSAQSPSTGFREVQEYVHRIQYNLLFAIPAFAVLFLWMCILVTAVVLWAARRFTLRQLRHLLNQTAMGRVTTNLLHPGLTAPDAPTSIWVEKAGPVHLYVPAYGGFSGGQGDQESPSRESGEGVLGNRDSRVTVT
ncbi:MAG: hypothetical protein M1832_002189 [Thelocarpon impressellum]|nr:MAG: hypothetical protein M1832_002189 [Thelocarpon impressellum]